MQAASSCQSPIPRSPVVVAGAPPHNDRHGTVGAASLGRLYRRADALLLASSHEGYGMVLAEALAAGLPIIATRVGAVPEVVRDGREAELVAHGDLTALARAIETELSLRMSR